MLAFPSNHYKDKIRSRKSTPKLSAYFLSLFQQNIGIENIELIFVDDASTDNNKTWEMLTDIERAFPESIIILKLEKSQRIW